MWELWLTVDGVESRWVRLGWLGELGWVRIEERPDLEEWEKQVATEDISDTFSEFGDRLTAIRCVKGTNVENPS